MKTIEENRETLNKKNNDLLNEIKESENKRNNEILNFEKELLHLKEQNEFILTKNKEYELINEKFKNDLRHKDNIIEKLENEINNLNELIDKKKFENKKYIEKFIIEFNDDKANWESEKENQNRKIFEMQENLRSCDMENMRLRHDYQRLAEILQSSLNRSILETFTNNNFI